MMLRRAQAANAIWMRSGLLFVSIVCGTLLLETSAEKKGLS